MGGNFDGGFANFMRRLINGVYAFFKNGDLSRGRLLTNLQRQRKPSKASAENRDIGLFVFHNAISSRLKKFHTNDFSLERYLPWHPADQFLILAGTAPHVA